VGHFLNVVPGPFSSVSYKFMCKHEITFDKLPQAITYLTEQVAELKQLVSELQAPQSEKHLLVGIDDACRIIQKAKPTIYALVRKGILPSYKKGKKLYFYEDELLAWIENGRKNTAEQNYDQMLASMQNGVRRKPKSGFNL
jgi:excisionase family DNA binding protein